MALYSMSIDKVGSGKSGARASAASWLDYVEREGRYANKPGLVEGSVFTYLPDHAPDFASVREVWQSVAAAAEGDSAELAREFRFALPAELTAEGRVELAHEFARSLAEEGMCVHVAVHRRDFEDEPLTSAELREIDERAAAGEDRARLISGKENWHAHATATVRAVGEDGAWKQRYESVYLLRDARGAERLCRGGDEWKQAKAEGWEKVYRYRGGDVLTQSEAQARGLHKTKDRVSSTPVKEPRSLTGWDEPEKVEEWRERWAAMQNRALERAQVAERVDHRSYERQTADPQSPLYGLDLQPQGHLGRAETERVRRGEYSERAEANRATAAHNRASIFRRVYELALHALEALRGKMRDFMRSESQQRVDFDSLELEYYEECEEELDFYESEPESEQPIAKSVREAVEAARACAEREQIRSRNRGTER